jgi:hypothetical protein
MPPGVRTMPAAMALPTATAIPNHTPSTCSSFPRPAEALAAAPAVLVEAPSDVLDNVESQESVRNSAIITVARQKASRNSVRSGNAASGVHPLQLDRNSARCFLVLTRVGTDEPRRQGTWR